MTILDHPDVRRMLIQQKAYAEGAIAICLYCARLLDVNGEEAEALLALLTPVAKSWPSEFGLIANDLAIQVHGGYGYTRDFDVEQLWRDSRLNPIHEGTAGIQAIDLLGRKLLRSDGRSMTLLRDRVLDTAARAEHHAGTAYAAADLTGFWDEVGDVLDQLREAGDGAFDEATMFLRAFGHGVIAWLWLDMAVAAAAMAETGQQVGVKEACRFFYESELPQARAWLSIVGRRSDLLRTIPDEAFA